jgi:hypothetical protein
MFEKLNWQEDRMLLDDLVFRLQHALGGEWDLGDECFIFYKSKKLVQEYADFFGTRAPASFRNVFELGIWEGGSVAFWFECFQPQKHVAADILRRSDSAYFRKYINSRALEARVKTCWGVDQSDSQSLRNMVHQEFDGPLDLVIDDASHEYAPTKASFETLFPLLRPGGLYIIEDWAWAHWEKFQVEQPKWLSRRPLSEFIVELLQLIATRPRHQKELSAVRNMFVYHGFVVVERGGLEIPPPGTFKIQDHIYTRPQTGESEQALDAQSVLRFREAIAKTVPAGATVLVVSKGEEQLLNLEGRRGWHFPQTSEGGYAGHYPADRTEALAQLEALKAKGAAFLAFPSFAFWWLNGYYNLRPRLERGGQCVWSDADCIIYKLA